MGYTHRWCQSADFTPDQWSAICKDVRKIISYCRQHGIVIQYEYDDSSRQCVFKEAIQFNGAGFEGHETFFIPYGPDAYLQQYNFCKTARKPYDLAVCLCLLRIAHHCPAFFIAPAGDWDSDWLNARATYTHLFKEEPPRVS